MNNALLPNRTDLLFLAHCRWRNSQAAALLACIDDAAEWLSGAITPSDLQQALTCLAAAREHLLLLFPDLHLDITDDDRSDDRAEIVDAVQAMRRAAGSW